MKSWYSDTRVLDLVSVGANGTEARYTHTPNSDDCIDQGLQNYLVFTGAFDRLFFDKVSRYAH